MDNMIKVLRKRENLNTTDFGAFLGISKSYVEKLESGDKSISKNCMRKIKQKYPELDMNIFFN